MPITFRKCQLRTKILVIILVAVIPIAISACLMLYSHYDEEYEEAEKEALTTAKVIAYQHQAQVDGIRAILTSIRHFPEVRRLDKAACAKLLGSISQSSQNNFAITIADPEGHLLVTGSQILTNGSNVSERKYFKDILKTKQFSTGEFAISKSLGKPTIHYALPVLDADGSILAVIIAIYDLTQFNSLFEDQKLPPNSVLNVTDHKGTVLHRYPNHSTVKPGFTDKPLLRARMTGTHSEGAFNDYGADNIKRLLAFKRLQLSPDLPPYMYIRVSIPVNEALEDTYYFIASSAVIFILSALFALISSRVLAQRYLLNPIKRLASVSQTTKAGDYSVRTGLPHTDDELGQLAQSFDSMIMSLDSRQQERELAESVQKNLEQALRVQLEEYKESQEELNVTGESLQSQIEAYHQTHDQLLATEEMLRVQLETVEMSEQKFRTSFNLSPVTIVLVGYSAGVYLEVNQSFIDTFGYSREETIGKNINELDIWSNPDDRKHFIQMMKRDNHISRYEAQMRVKGGGLITALFSAGFLEVDGRRCLLCIIADISEEKRLETMLIQSQKMEAVGNLAGGIAHDFNNLLTPIIGYSEMLAVELAALDGKVERAERITQAAMKARDLTKQLLTFGRKQNLDVRPIELNDIVTEFSSLLHRTIRESIIIQFSLSAEATKVCADRTQIEQIIMNLAVNAQDAIADKGTITIETAAVELDEEFVRHHPGSVAGHYIMIAVTDSGHGMDKKTQEHVFEPFFTTKGPGEGTGLGLANVYGIVKQHKGNIWLYSEPGHGTVFKIYLPSIDYEQVERTSAIDVVYENKNAFGTILLVEDDENVRAMAHELLMDLGYNVIVTENPLMALPLVDDKVIDLLVTDVIMPGMSGPELYEKLQKSLPELKVLFMSGYTNNVVSKHIELKDGFNFIQKPFTLNDMASKVAALLVD